MKLSNAGILEGVFCGVGEDAKACGADLDDVGYNVDSIGEARVPCPARSAYRACLID